jgi:hypothetical protein
MLFVDSRQAEVPMPARRVKVESHPSHQSQPRLPVPKEKVESHPRLPVPKEKVESHPSLLSQPRLPVPKEKEEKEKEIKLHLINDSGS